MKVFKIGQKVRAIVREVSTTEFLTGTVVANNPDYESSVRGDVHIHFDSPSVDARFCYNRSSHRGYLTYNNRYSDWRTDDIQLCILKTSLIKE